MLGLSIVYFGAICKADGWVLVFNCYFVEKGPRKMGALVNFLGNFVKSGSMFGLGMVHGWYRRNDNR